MSLRTALHRSRFHPMGALLPTVGGYRPQQRVKQRGHDSTLRSDQSGGQAVDGLQSPLEAARLGAQPLAQGCPSPHRTAQRIGQPIHPQFLPHHRRGSAPQHVHAKRHLDRAQGERTVPAFGHRGPPRRERCRPWRPARSSSPRTPGCATRVAPHARAVPAPSTARAAPPRVVDPSTWA